MIDLTPLDVRKKRGDFAKTLRGFDPQEVDAFLELVAERMEVLVKENLAFREKILELGEKVVLQEGREQAVQDALVTAQELRQDVKKQASREAKLLEREARGRIEGMIAESEKLLNEHGAALQELERQRHRFLKGFRTLLERELDTVEVEIGRAPLEEITVDLDLGKGSPSLWDDADPETTAADPETTADDAAAEGAVEVAADPETTTAADPETTADDAAAAGAVEAAADLEATVADPEATVAPREAAAADLEATVAHQEVAADPETTVAQREATADQDASQTAGGEADQHHDQASKQEGGDSLWLSSIIKDENTE